MDNSWIEYSISKVSVFAMPAGITPFLVLHYPYPHHKLAFLTGKKCKEGGFKCYSKSDHHRSAMFAWKQHQNGYENKYMHCKFNKYGEGKENERELGIHQNNCRGTATQNITQRGHRESNDSNNKGNFLAISEQIAKHDPLIEKRMDAYGNAKYTSKGIQN